jgi:L-alanine-DL-glutamate epimerase-like enolase superfamily enzyme
MDMFSYMNTLEQVIQPAPARHAPRIRALACAPVLRLPLPRPWGGDVTEFALVFCDVEADDGAHGVGFTWVPGLGADAVHSLLEQDVSRLAHGLPAEPEVVWDILSRRLRELGNGGVTTLALAALDIALWDLAARRQGRSLVDLIGRRRDKVEVYGSGVNRHYSLSELCAQAERWVAAGHRAVKIKVGGDGVDLHTDVERVAAVREVIGPDRLLMIDANQHWNLAQAEQSVRALSAYNLHWIEEPLPADDLAGYARLRARIDVPIACGENLYSIQSFRDLVTTGGADVLQPNVVRVGGITPFLRIAALGSAFGVTVAPHLLPELSGQLALCLPEPTLVEDVEDTMFSALGALRVPSGVVASGPWLTADTAPGHGLRFASSLSTPTEAELR